METVNKVNNLSSKLRDLVKKSAPKNGQTIWFTSVRPNARGTTALPYDRIFDPWGQEEGTSIDGFIDIAYIVGRDPGKGPNGQPVDRLGRIQFNKPAGGRMSVKGGDKAGEQLFEYLFLTNQNRNNHPSKNQPDGAEWFVPGKQAVCYMEQPDKSADQKLEDNRKIRQAGNAIDAMPEEKLRDFALGLDLPGITRHSKENEIRVKLLAIASTVQGAERVLALDKDSSLAVKIDIKKAEKLNVIVFDAQLSVWKWVDGQDNICVVPPSGRKYEALVAFFLGKGSGVYKTVLQLLKSEQDKK